MKRLLSYLMIALAFGCMHQKTNVSYNKATKESDQSNPTLLADAGNNPATLFHPSTSKKDTVVLEGKHHRHPVHYHSTKTTVPVVKPGHDQVVNVFNNSYVAMIKGVVYKKGTNEILNNTKIVLHAEEKKIDSSVTAIAGMYTLHVYDKKVKHKMYVIKKGYKPLAIDIPDTLLEKHQLTVVKIHLEPDGTDIIEEQVVILLKGKVLDGTGLPASGAVIQLVNNVEKTSQQVVCDAAGKYSVELKKYAHYTIVAAKAGCSSEKINKSTLSTRESITWETNIKLLCQE